MKMLVICLFIVCIISQAAVGAGAYDGYDHDHHTSSSSSSAVVIRLTHHHSVFSPTYNLNHSQTITDRANFDLHTSLQRASLVSPSDDDYHYSSSRLTPQKNQSGFLAHIQIGSQNMDQFVVMDTLNSFFWINCQPCSVYVTPPVYDPTTSSSYRTQDCVDAEACLSTDIVDLDCHFDVTSESCSFQAYYADQVYTSGELAIENLTLEKSSVSQLVLENVTFGCSHDANLYGANGIMGLGKSSLSIVKQQRFSTFSYCIGNISDPTYPHHKLILADTFNFNLGNETPISSGPSDNYYFINLEKIYIYYYPLDFDPSVLRRNPNASSGGMVVDTSSTYTFLPQVVFEKLVPVLRIELALFVKNESFPYMGQSRLCYNGVFARDLIAFPTVTLHFQGGAIMELVNENLFHQVSEENFCFAILPIDMFYPGSTVSIMGSLIQQFFYLGFDLALNKFAFDRADCSLIG